MLVAGLLATAVYVAIQPDLLDDRVFGNFYDIQARALLDGHLAVPDGSLGNEAFVVDGRDYLYNPPGPALLRLPVFLVTDDLDGRLTVLSMLAAWGVTLVVTSLLVWRVRHLLRGRVPLPWWEAVAYGGLLVAATCGSTLLFLGSIPWIFHEAYAWAIAMSLGALHALLGFLEAPSARRAAAAGGFTLGALLSRTTAGWACAAAALGVAAWMFRGRRWSEHRDLWWPIALAGLVPVALAATVNWAKFRHPYAFPIENQVFTSLSQDRRAALAATGGDGFSPEVILTTGPAYLRPDGIRFTSVFPFITLPAEPPAEYAGVVLERSYRTGSIVAFMPLLVGLTAYGIVTAVRGAGRAALLRFPLLGAALIPVAVLFAAGITHRYTSEFVPLLVVGSAVGAVALVPRLIGLELPHRRAALAALGVAAGFGLAANLAVALSAQALANPGPVLADHLGRQRTVSGWTGDPLEDRVTASVHLPATSEADEVRIVGDCQALYVGTGEVGGPWSEVGVRGLTLSLEREGGLVERDRGEVAIADLTGHRSMVISIERDGERYRPVLRGGGLDLVGPWFRPTPGTPVDLEIRADPDRDDYEVAVFGQVGIRVPRSTQDEQFVALPTVLAPRVSAPTAAEGLRLSPEPGRPPPHCEALLDRYLEVRTVDPPG
jgi:hypothetical protein